MTHSLTHPEQITAMQREACICGHLKTDHIYHEGACRPGFVCASECREYTTTIEAGTSPARDGGILAGPPQRTFASLTPNQREQVVRKLVYLSGDRGHWATYLMPERVALSIARLTEYIAMLPDPVRETAQLERDLWWKLDSDRRMEEHNAPIRAMYQLSRYVGGAK